jgi:Ca2+-binding EF-hand superfamily protein
MHKQALIAAAVAAATAATALPAAAAAAPEPAPLRAAIMFWLLDRNGDGVIDRAEIEALRAAAFDALDQNHDGILTKDEVSAALAAARARVAERGANAIKNGPGAGADREQRILTRLGVDNATGVAKQDFLSRNPRLFARVDTNGDGKISKDEFAAMAGAGHGGALMPE